VVLTELCPRQFGSVFILSAISLTFVVTTLLVRGHTRKFSESQQSDPPRLSSWIGWRADGTNSYVLFAFLISDGFAVVPLPHSNDCCVAVAS
jgi:hypothetical protein